MKAKMSWTRLWLGALAVTLLLGAQNAVAEPVKGRVRLTLDTTPLAIINTTVRGSVGIGGLSDENKYEVDQLTLGVAPSFGASVGFGVADQFLVGVRFTLTATTTEQGAADYETESATYSTASTTILMLPYVMFIGGQNEASIRFTASVMAGLGSTRVRVGGESPRNTTGGAIGAAIGFAGFAAERFSIDPSLFVLYEAGSGNFGDDGQTSADYDYSGTTLGVLLSFSGWLGKDLEEAPRQETPRWTMPPHAPHAQPVAPAAPPAPKAAVLSTRTTLDSAIFMLLGAPEQRGPEVALRIQRYAPATEAECASLDIELDGAVVKTIPLKQSAREDQGVQELTVQGSIDVDLAESIARARVAKLRWCGNERTLSLAARDGITRFIASMRARLAELPPIEAPPAPAEETPATTPEAAPAPATAPEALPGLAPAAAPTP